MDPAPFVLLFVFIGLPVLLFGGQALFQRRYRKKKQAIARQDFPDDWERILSQSVPIVSKLPSRFAKRLRRNIQLFLAEVGFEAQGLELTDEIRVTIAAQACLLTIGRKNKRYPKLRSVIVYPTSFTDGPKSRQPEDGKPAVRHGESWQSGSVVLAWDITRAGARNAEDGKNVAMHEFAHQLDQEDHVADGAPLLDRDHYATWADVFSREYEIQVRKALKGKRSVLSHYGATHPAEFFAVATEAFFEKPKPLKRKRPDVYKILRHYYRLDPVSWD